MTLRSRTLALALIGAVGACHDPLVYDVVTGPRDWAANPAIVALPASPTVFAVSDIHGGYARFTALLAHNGLVDSPPASPDAAAWTGGDAVLIIVGDMIDKGPDSVDTVDFVRALQTGASATGGRVVALVGNHEAEFFADPTNSKADSSEGIDTELDKEKIDLVAFASGADPRGAWLRQQPFGARVGAWFFAHAGNTKGRTLDELEQDLQRGFDANDFRDGELVGDDSLLEARGWYGDAATVTKAAQALGVGHFVFGHDPSALGPRGKIGTAQAGALFRIDCGMTPSVDDSQGMLLRIRHDATGDTAEQLDASGSTTELWNGT